MKTEKLKSYASPQDSIEPLLLMEGLKYMLRIASSSNLVPGGHNFHLLEDLQIGGILRGVTFVEHTIKLYAVPAGEVWDTRVHDPVRVLKTKKQFSDPLDFKNKGEEVSRQVIRQNVENAIRDMVINYFIKVVNHE